MKLLVTFLFCLLVCLSALGQNKYSTTVKLTVAGDESIKSEVESYLNRELRALGDVTVVDNDPTWEIQVIVMETRSVQGGNLGYAFSILVAKSFKNISLKAMKCEESDKNLIKIIYEPARTIEDFRLLVTGPGTESLQSLCKKAIAQFDTDTLNPIRKSWNNSIKQ